MSEHGDATSFCNKCGFVGVPQEGGFHYRPKDGQLCNYLAPIAIAQKEQGK